MPVRIYALAKELKLDSKKLVDLCAQAGIADKGSALASLTDDESSKIRAYISGGGKSSGKRAKAGPAVEVDLELVLLADASGSIDQAEIKFQRQGYASAITHPQVLAIIAKGALGRIAVT